MITYESFDVKRVLNLTWSFKYELIAKQVIFSRGKMTKIKCKRYKYHISLKIMTSEIQKFYCFTLTLFLEELTYLKI